MPSDIYHDRNVDPVDYNDKDAFVLDGKRLIKTSPTTYETAIKDFSRITSVSTTYSGIQFFTVESKDGLVYEYGNTVNSRMIAAGTSYACTWALNCIRDRMGNRIDFTYTNNPTTAVFYIAGITYGSNPLAGIVTPPNEIVFNYDIKDDKNFQYIYGAKIMTDVRMTTILIKNAGTTIHRYDMQYAMDFYSHLIGISETGEGGTILPPTAITWGTETTLTSGYNTSVLTETGYAPYVADINGDGVSDIVDVRYITPHYVGAPVPHYKLYNNTKSNDFSFVNEGDMSYAPDYANDPYFILKNTYNGRGVILDFNGDGRDDIITTSYSLNDYYMYLYLANSTGDNFNAPIILAHYINTTSPLLTRFQQIRFALGDFTGTKKMSVFIFVPDDEGTGPTKSYITTLIGDDFTRFGTYIGEVKDFNAMDYDGDGKDDLFITNGFDFNSKAYSVDMSYDPATGAPLSGMTLSLNSLFTSGYPNQGHRIYYGDFNGDGKKDVLTWSGAANPWDIGYAKGTGGFDIHNMPSLLYNNVDPDLSLDDNNIFIADFNGDGKDDILEMFGSGPAYVLNIIYSKGNNVFENEPLVLTDLCGIGETHYSVGDFNGDGKADLLESSYSGCYYHIIYFHENEQKQLVRHINKTDNSITNNGHKYNIEYKPVAMDADYTNSSAPAYPNSQRAVGGYTVVKHFYDSFNDIDNVGINSTYKYGGLTIQKLGLGFKGFETFAIYDAITHKHTLNQFDVLSWATAVPKLSQTYYTPTYEALGLSTYFFNEATLDNNIKIVYPTDEYSVDYVSHSQTHTNYVYNSDGTILPSLYHYGEPDQIITNTSGGQEVTTKEFVYGIWNPADPAFYNLGKPKQTTVTIQRPGQPAYARTTSFVYTPDGQTDSYIADPATAHSNYFSYLYDLFGNCKQETRVTVGLGTAKTFDYSPDGKFLTHRANELTYAENYTFDEWGNTLTGEDINNLTTTNHYNDFNRLVSTTSPTGVTTTYSYVWATSLSSCPPMATYPSYAVITETPGIAGGKTIFYDYAGRKIRTVTNAFDGSPVYQDLTYSSNNTVLSSTDPYVVGGTPNVTNYTYDNLDRLIQTVSPACTVTTAYGPIDAPTGEMGGMKTVVTNTSASPWRVKETTTDGTGKVTLITDGDSYTGYTYHSNGKLCKTILNSSYDFLYNYDDYGNVVSEFSPNKGWTYNVYNGRDQLVTTTDATPTTFSFARDVLGRVQTKSWPGGSYTYIYGTTANTLGKLVHESAPVAGMSTDYTYDANARLIQMDETVGGLLFTTNYTYDVYNRTTSTTYPTGDFVLSDYNTYGYFTGVGTVSYSGMPWDLYRKNTVNVYGQTTNAAYAPYSGATTIGVPDPPPVYTETNTYNAHGTLTASKLTTATGGIMNNYVYSFNEATGDLDMRKDLRYGRTENFTYDVHDRLTSAQQSDVSGITGTQNFDYAPEGSILHKSDVSAEPWLYNGYGVVSIPNPMAVIPVLTQSVTYTVFNKIKTVEEGDNKIVFTYNAADERGMAQYYTAGVLTKTRYYASNCEKTVDAATGDVVEVCYVGAEGKLVAMFVTEGDGTDIKYVLTDYQGSITHILRPTGSILEERSYDAWGRMRNPDNWTYTGLDPHAFDRGYTGQELLSDFNIINLNGRLYDPLIGKMFSVDPAISDVYNAQTYNAYSYACNNPLKYTDPTGNFIFLPIIGAMIAAAVIDGGVQAVEMKMDHNRKFDGGEMFGAGLAGGVFVGFAAVAPTTAAAGEIGKALYAGLGSSASAVTARFTDDICDNGKINGTADDYIHTALTGFAIGAGISIGYSVYDYVTWGHYSMQQRMDIINNEYGTTATYDQSIKDDYAVTKITSPTTADTKFGPYGLESRPIARNTAEHELQHVNDFLGNPTYDGDLASNIHTTGDFQKSYWESRAHILDMKLSGQEGVPYRDWVISRHHLINYGYTGKIPNVNPLTLWFNMFR